MGIDHQADARIKFDLNESIQVMPTFDSLGLKEDLLRGIYSYGIVTGPHRS
jgi:ATP-dependent RNA helicase